MTKEKVTETKPVPLIKYFIQAKLLQSPQMLYFITL